MDKLVKEGKVRIKGQSAYSADDFEKTVPVVKPAGPAKLGPRPRRSIHPPRLARLRS